MLSRIWHKSGIGLILIVLVGTSFFIGFAVADAHRPVAVSIASVIRDVLPEPEREVPTYSSGIYNLDFFDVAYEKALRTEPPDDDLVPRSAVVPHHLLVASDIARTFEWLPKNARTVVLISPNHFDVGKGTAQVSYGTWETPYGTIETDVHAVDDLLATVPELTNEEATFEHEHGISAITPFVARSLPHAKIVPIVVHDSMTDDEIVVLSEVIAKELPRAVVIASVDMSHYLPSAVADYHDTVTQYVLERGGCDGDLCGADLEVDSQAALKLLFAINNARGSQYWMPMDHTNSYDMGATTDWRENTSHISGVFTDGGVNSDPFVAIHFVGDIMLDRGVRKQINAAGDPSYPWKEIGRFLDGSHLVVGNLEGTVNQQKSTYTYDPPFRFVFDPSYIDAMKPYIDVVSLANNHASDVGSAGELETHTWLDKAGIPWFGSYRHPTPRYDTTINGMDLTFIGYHAFQPDEAALVDEIKKAHAEDRFVIVMPHWGTEYRTTPDSSEVRLAKLMVDAGADLIVGGHPHVPQTIEELGGGEGNGVKVVYSLGNFVFDQEIPATWNAMTVGVIIEKNSSSNSYIVGLYPMPVYTRYGQPVPLP